MTVKCYTKESSIRTTEYWFDSTLISIEEFAKLNFLTDSYHKYLYNTGDKPSIIETGDMLKCWWRYGKLHRENGPAIIDREEYPYVYEAWYNNDLKHRIGAPAVYLYSRNTIIEEYFYIYNIEFESNEYDAAMRFLQDNGELAFKLRYR